MKNPLFILTLTFGVAFGPAGAFADDATTLQVAPSDQIVYPDASQVLNKPAAPAAKTPTTDPAAVATTKPLVASTPVLASAAVATAKSEAHGWYLRWSFSDHEAAVRAWAEALGRPVLVNPADGQWEVLEGPLDATSVKIALEGQGGKASLVRR